MKNNDSDILYHYTKRESLEGILKSQTLWSTHYQKMNDEKELRHFPEYLLRRLSEKSDKGLRKRKIKSHIKYCDIVLHNHLDGTENSRSPDIYVISFCPDGHSIRLRNQYGNYSIGFDKNKMDNLLDMEGKKFGFDMSIFEPVVYDGKDIPRDFEDESDDIINQFNNFIKKKVNDRQEGIKKYLINVTLFKSNKWSYEHEYRLVVGKLFPKYNSNPKNKTVKCRGKDQSIPYIELFDDKDILLPIREIIIGSSLDFKSEKKWIENLLKEKGIDNTVKISKSTL